MDKFFRGRNKQDILFGLLSVVLLTALLGYAAYSLAFLARAVNGAINISLIKTPEVVTVNLKQLEALRKR